MPFVRVRVLVGSSLLGAPAKSWTADTGTTCQVVLLRAFGIVSGEQDGQQLQLTRALDVYSVHHT